MENMKTITTKQLIAEILRFKESEDKDGIQLNEGMAIYNDIVRNEGKNTIQMLMNRAEAKRYDSLMTQPWSNGYNIPQSYEAILAETVKTAVIALGGCYETEYLNEDAARTWGDLRMAIAEFRQYAARYLPEKDVYSLETMNYDVRYNKGEGAYAEMYSKLDQFSLKDAQALRKDLNQYISVPNREEFLNITTEIEGMIYEFKKELEISEQEAVVPSYNHSNVSYAEPQYTTVEKNVVIDEYAMSDEDLTFLDEEIQEYKAPKHEIFKGATAYHPEELSDDEVISLLEGEMKPQKAQKTESRGDLSSVFEALKSIGENTKAASREIFSRGAYTPSL